MKEYIKSLLNGITDNKTSFIKFWFYYMLCSLLNIFYEVFNYERLSLFLSFLLGSNNKKELYGSDVPVKIKKD
jgi:hypothetical protein